MLVVFGIVFGGLFVWFLKPAVTASTVETEATDQTVDIAALNADVERLKGIAPTQSHIMADAALQFSSLWFAAREKNWALATFLFNETRGRIRWTIRINPKPKAAGSQEEVDLQGIFDAVDKDVLTPLKDAIDNRVLLRVSQEYEPALLASNDPRGSRPGRPELRSGCEMAAMSVTVPSEQTRTGLVQTTTTITATSLPQETRQRRR
jgi:hypothetical protein